MKGTHARGTTCQGPCQVLTVTLMKGAHPRGHKAPGVQGPPDLTLFSALPTRFSAPYSTSLLAVQKVESAPAAGPLFLVFPLPWSSFFRSQSHLFSSSSRIQLSNNASLERKSFWTIISYLFSPSLCRITSLFIMYLFSFCLAALGLSWGMWGL